MSQKFILLNFEKKKNKNESLYHDITNFFFLYKI